MATRLLNLTKSCLQVPTLRHAICYVPMSLNVPDSSFYVNLTTIFLDYVKTSEL